MPYTTREADPRADAGTIYQFVCELAEFERLRHEVVLQPAQMRADFEAGHFEAIIAEDETGTPVGFALYLFHVYSTFEGLSLHLEDLYVSPAARGSGCGSLLLQAVANVAKDKNCARLQWQALSWNERAIAFYKSPAVGARERIDEKDGTTWVNFVLRRQEIAALASKKQVTKIAAGGGV